MSVNIEICEERISKKQEEGSMTCDVIVSNIRTTTFTLYKVRKGVGLK